MYSWQVSRPLPGFLGQLQVLINYCASVGHSMNVPKWENRMNAQIAPKVDTIRKITPPSFSLDPIPIPTGEKKLMMGRDHCASSVLLFANRIQTRANLLHTLLGVNYFALWITVIWHPARLNEAKGMLPNSDHLDGHVLRIRPATWFSKIRPLWHTIKLFKIISRAETISVDPQQR